jgi:hypothetical protein
MVEFADDPFRICGIDQRLQIVSALRAAGGRVQFTGHGLLFLVDAFGRLSVLRAGITFPFQQCGHPGSGFLWKFQK